MLETPRHWPRGGHGDPVRVVEKPGVLESRTGGPVDQVLVLDESDIEVPAAEGGQRHGLAGLVHPHLYAWGSLLEARIAGTTRRVITEAYAPRFTVPLSRSDMA